MRPLLQLSISVEFNIIYCYHNVSCALPVWCWQHATHRSTYQKPALVKALCLPNLYCTTKVIHLSNGCGVTFMCCDLWILCSPSHPLFLLFLSIRLSSCLPLHSPQWTLETMFVVLYTLNYYDWGWSWASSKHIWVCSCECFNML